MHMFFEFLYTMAVLFKSIFWGIYHAIVPAPQKSVEGEIVLMTGAGSGIGRLMCEELARRGATIVAWDINKEGNEETAQRIKLFGGRVHTYICDVSNREDVRKVSDQVKREVGDVTILVNNAGIVTGRNFLDCTDEQLIRTMNVNVMAHFWTLKNFLPSMVAKNHGHIVTIASIAGFVGVNGLADYCASKHANVGFTESLAMELALDKKDGVFTTTICPYQITTGMFEGCAARFPKLMPFLTPEYAANRIVRAILTNQTLLCMPRSMYQTIFMKSFLPVEGSLALTEFLGGLDFMNNFTGRGKQQ